MRRAGGPPARGSRSLSGLSLRSLRARPLRSLLTAGAIVLGVGMVFGVLLLVGTIHSTFNQLFDSIYGKTDVVVSGQQSAGALPTVDDPARAGRSRRQGGLGQRRLDLPHHRQPRQGGPHAVRAAVRRRRGPRPSRR